MVENINSKKPLVGFMPVFDNFGETYPLVEIAKKYMELGGEAIFIGYGNKYEKLVKDIGCRIIKIRSRYFPEKLSEKSITFQEKFHDADMDLAQEKFYSNLLFSKKWEKSNIEALEKEIKIFRDEKVELIMTGFIFTTLLSARIVKIPVVFLLSGVAIPPYFEAKHASFPDNYENAFTRILPQFIKDYLTNWRILRCNWSVRGFNRLANKYNVQTIKRFLDLFLADCTLVADDMNFLNLCPTSNFPSKNFVGPILSGLISETCNTHIDHEIEEHIKRPGKSIIVTYGSSGAKNTLLSTINALNKTDYNVIVVYTTILNEDELPEVNDNILLKKFVPSIKKVHEMTDLAIIHGGRGTVYTAAYAGKPAIGIPMKSEQQYNLDNLVRHRTAIRLSKKYFDEKKLFETIDDIFNNYNEYLKNAKLLQKMLPEPNGAENAAKRILDIWKNYVKN
jgi:UDP:flavonoid glycosyltransferase YjiC (YdhE family)